MKKLTKLLRDEKKLFNYLRTSILPKNQYPRIEQINKGKKLKMKRGRVSKMIGEV